MIIKNSVLATMFLCILSFVWPGSSCNDSNMKTNSNRSGSNSSQTSEALANGVWGGENISLEVSERGAVIDYNCAHGSITEKILLSRDGKFTAKGFHVKENPGP